MDYLFDDESSFKNFNEDLIHQFIQRGLK